MTADRIFFAAMAIITTMPSQVMGQGYAPTDAMKQMTVNDGLGVSLFAHEPEVRQAIFVKCDDRGRLWTIQYLQYPNPAGLRRVKIDRWSRTIYDRVPKPPPYGPRGADKITICEDTDGDGRADEFTDFVDGLNLVTGVAFGHGGVFVLNVPYLLFYPDRDQDDVPDSDPEVLLSGFGMEDAQSMANHLTWGPDGWLYGVNGSTTTCNIRGIEFQSGAWRYHPLTKKFELFCEGGYNCYGLTFDENGELLYSTNGGPFIHAMQGAYYYKSFGKHGPLHNQFAYHHFPIQECDQVPGGPPTGGTIYLGNTFPEHFRGKFIAGNFLGHTVSWWKLHPQGSSFRATYGDVLFDSHDTWVGPTDVCLGPHGEIYVSDFHDKRTAHPDPDAQWDLSNGRIYKIAAKNQTSSHVADLSKLPSDQLIDLFQDDNGWLADRVRVELAHRQDKSVAKRLLSMAQQKDNGRLALQGLWALNAVGAVDEAVAHDLLEHPYPYVRFWTTRLLGDSGKISPALAEKLADMASRESSAPVVAQLACTAKRLPAEYALPIIEQLLYSQFAETDERIPWLIWWAIESKSMTATDSLINLLSTEQAWRLQAYRDNALRLIRRWSAEGNQKGYKSCLALLESAPVEYQLAALEHLRLGLSERAVGLHGIGQGGLFDQQAADDDAPPTVARGYEPLTEELKRYIQQIWHENQSDVLYLELAIRAKVTDAYRALLETVQQSEAENDSLTDALALLREVGDTDASTAVLGIIASNQSEPISIAAIEVVDAHGNGETVQMLQDDYHSFSPSIRTRLRDLFFSRIDSAKSFLGEIGQGNVPVEEVPVSQLSQLASHKDKEIDDLVRQLWGKIGRGSTEETLATMRRYNNDLRAGTGDLQNGKMLFTKHCAVCHQLHGEGNRVGPDLTTANRKDLAALLGNIVDPSAVVRREYESYVVLTDAGRTLTGLMAEQNAAAVTLIDAQNRRVKIPRDEIEEIFPSDVSLMPDRLLEQLTPQQLRDLFAYLEK